MQNSQNVIAQIIQSPRDDQKVEVLLEQKADAPRVALRYSTWTDGLGWCAQKTIHLEADQLDDLHHAIAVARQRINRQRADAGQLSQTGQVIHLPTLA